ncbi:Poly(rC)-binding protein 2 [Wickerhamomyces ciferrii]|uniref:Poly(RC)-binding protein 2 n=1 Tax=Wickerhamomyces ciferrii (strain ATCC 14091 / BCRC 22168 / CBS 111 / JCM 3599 / NBRC 0793 / NRRL Y-1031 F-60-10) TaxID=1206466 RepID=K0KCF1_WICCF|nr:Poly(rC)-binding protein 2 [Wickerhamomyces ciferrii]CCH40576.1 Poly(rC)-binding protein 2 [Wickerhamomyces ciferrii]
MLKRKNEEVNAVDQSNSGIKRVALDAEVVEAQDEDGAQDHDMIKTEDNQENNDINSAIAAAVGGESSEGSRAISSHKVHQDGDPTYVHFRMLCQVKEAALVVGKGGEKISHIKEVSGTRINVSENIRGVTERVIHVRGPAENVAKAFGLMTRAILDEEENVPSTVDSHHFALQLLIPHQVIGYVIGKQGGKFKEIEENSAAKLNASSHSMPFSTDRCLTIAGVADSIHIATYYVAQTVLTHKPNFKGKVIFYDPGQQHQHHQQQQQQHLNLPQHHLQHHQPGLPPNPLLFNGMMNFGQLPQFDQRQLLQFNNFARPQHNRNHNGKFQQRPPFSMNVPINPLTLPLASSTGGVGGSPQITQEIFIPNEYVGNVIGKSGKNIKLIKDTSGSKIQIADPNPESKERKITLVGTSAGNQTAIFLINNRIESDKRSNEAKAKSAAPQNHESDSIKKEIPEST